jgi:hypothetical protein
MTYPTVGANTSPIYPRVPFSWLIVIKDAVVSPVPAQGQSPVIIGTAESSGSLIESIEIIGLSDTDPKDILIYKDSILNEGLQSNKYYLWRYLAVPIKTGKLVEVPLPSALPLNGEFRRDNSDNLIYESLPKTRNCKLEPNQSLYCALSAIDTTGFVVSVIGGHY